MVAINTRSNAIPAVGTEAKATIGRTPGHIVAIRPLKDGVMVVDYRRLQAWWPVVLATVVLALVGVLGTVGMFKLNVLREYQKERLTAFIDPGADDGGRGFTYNSRQALIAIGSGGVGGKGYLRGTQTNLQYVPEQKTDFISPSSARSSASPAPWPSSPCSGCCSGAACGSPLSPGTRSASPWPPG